RRSSSGWNGPCDRRKGNGLVMHKPSKLLESDVQDQLAWDSQVDATRIVVSANDSKVTLSGSVPTYSLARCSSCSTTPFGRGIAPATGSKVAGTGGSGEGRHFSASVTPVTASTPGAWRCGERTAVCVAPTLSCREARAQAGLA